jgi:hypothetical protein
MLTVSIRDADCDDVEITQLLFQCQLDFEQNIDQAMDDFFAMYGSGSCGFYAIIIGQADNPEPKYLSVSCN